MKLISLGVAPLALLIVGISANCSTPPEGAEARTANRADAARANELSDAGGVFSAVSKIQKCFKVPISLEWAYVEEDRSSVETRGFSYSIIVGETLESALDRLCEVSEDHLQWGRIQNIICVWPTGAKGRLESLLDSQVTLELKGSTTWNAILALCKAINTSVSSDRILMPRAEPHQDQYLPPMVLRTDTITSLSVSDVPAREALCAIVAAAPVLVEFTYSNFYRPGTASNRGPTATLTIRAYDEDGNILYHVPESRNSPENFLWHEETKSL